VSQALSVEELFLQKKEILELELLNADVGLDRVVVDADVSGPGLALAGYIERFPAERVQVFGQTELEYLSTLDDALAEERLDRVFALGIPAALVSKGQEVPAALLRTATRHGVPVFRSNLSTRHLYRKLKPYLERALAPSTSLHGSLADVYGVGVLFQGPSGIGKSECVLDLVERGHRLVADDVVMVTRPGNDVLIGRGLELQQHHMEIRGVGIIDVRALFGVRAARQQKRIEVVLRLEHWDDRAEYDRTGLPRGETTILDVPIPCVTVPLNPGKNITVIAEVVAMNHLLRYSGVDSAADFNQRLKDAMRPVREYLEEDYE